ncbi:MAG: DUF3347 domain-containing protein [Cyclobacteriaceae bacterium]|nr:DUF3347 domain-containing protein [Cyclobacteriaceae bacterium]
MKKFISTNYLILLLSISLYSCNNIAPKNNQTDEGGGTKELITAYLAIKDALVETDREKAKSKAENFQNIAKSEEGLAELNTLAGKIAMSETIEDQRFHFYELSDGMYTYLKENTLNITLYKQFCPMAFNNSGGFWISDSKEILNPFFGSKMLNCGVVQETLGE